MIQKIKNKVHAVVFWQTSLGEFVNKMVDLKLFYKYSFGHNKLQDKTNFEFYLTKQYHIIEKGLALPKPRLEFGKTVIENLIKKSLEYYNLYGKSPLLASISSCMNEYLQFNIDSNVDISKPYYKDIKAFIDLIETNKSGGTKTITKEDIKKAIDFNFDKFIKTRTSVRDFSNKSIELNKIKEIINTAKYTPSVCNRQGWKAHAFGNKELIKKLLTLQNGNRGFTENVDKLIIVTGNLKAFTKLESNQIYIDGGLFAMNILLALHAKGLGAVALNTCLPFTTEIKIKNIANIEKFEKLIMMIAVGNIKDDFKVATSNRKNINSIYKEHN